MTRASECAETPATNGSFVPQSVVFGLALIWPRENSRPVLSGGGPRPTPERRSNPKGLPSVRGSAFFFLLFLSFVFLSSAPATFALFPRTLFPSPESRLHCGPLCPTHPCQSQNSPPRDRRQASFSKHPEPVAKECRNGGPATPTFQDMRWQPPGSKADDLLARPEKARWSSPRSQLNPGPPPPPLPSRSLRWPFQAPAGNSGGIFPSWALCSLPPGEADLWLASAP